MAKTKSAGGKPKSGPKFDVQKFLLEKGERVGLIVAGVFLALLALLGLMAAGSAASPSKLSGDLKAGTQRIQSNLTSSPDKPPPVPPFDQGTFARLGPNDYP